MELFPWTSHASIRYDSNRLLSFRDACTEAPKELENRDIEGLTIYAGASVSNSYDKVAEDERNKRYGNRGFNCTQTQEIGPLGLPPAIAEGSKGPWGTQSEKETVCSTAQRILNKLTPENYEELTEQLVPELVQAGMTSTEDLVAVTSLIYDEAVMKPGLYAKLCVQLSKAMPKFPHLDGEKPVTFGRVLLNSCQKVFEGQDALREKIKNLTKPGQAVERDEKEKWAKLRTLGNIKLIGELFNERMLSERIVHECIQGLLGQDRKGTLDEGNVEALCLLFTTVGKQLAESAKWKLVVDKYFAQLKVIGESTALPLRLRFMVRNVLDKLRANKWVSGLEELKTTKVPRFGSPRVRAGGVGARDFFQARRTELNVSPGTRSPVTKPTTPDLTKKSESLLKEYFSIVDLNEALLCVQELKSPSFHPEFVRLAIATALGMRDKECDLVLKLLVHLQSKDAISSSDLRGGVLLLTEGMEDLAMDARLAPMRFGGMLSGLVLSGAAELQLVQEAIWKLDDDFLQHDVLNAVVAKWKLQENQEQLVDVCQKVSVDKEALLSMVVASDLVKVMELGASRAAAMPELMLHDNFDMRSNKDDFNLRSLLQRVQMYGK